MPSYEDLNAQFVPMPYPHYHTWEWEDPKPQKAVCIPVVVDTFVPAFLVIISLLWSLRYL